MCCLPRLHFALQVPLRAQVRHTALPFTLGSSPDAASSNSETVWKRLPRKRSSRDSSAQELKVGTRVTPAFPAVELEAELELELLT